MTSKLILASSSPRRHQLLAAAGVEFTVVSPDIDETPLEGERAAFYVERLAREKANAVEGEFVLAADTTVECDGAILGKPSDDAEACHMLRSLSGRNHYVHTGVAVRRGAEVASLFVSTEVTFIELTDADIHWYVSTGEPSDKAGAYAMQGGAARFVAAIKGSVSGVIGLPMAETIELLRAMSETSP
jgi:septum formation protein